MKFNTNVTWITADAFAIFIDRLDLNPVIGGLSGVIKTKMYNYYYKGSIEGRRIDGVLYYKLNSALESINRMREFKNIDVISAVVDYFNNVEIDGDDALMNRRGYYSDDAFHFICTAHEDRIANTKNLIYSMAQGFKRLDAPTRDRLYAIMYKEDLDKSDIRYVHSIMALYSYLY